MNFLRDKALSRFMLLLLVLQIFNFSVDTPDIVLNPLQKEDSTTNDMESIAEVILEKFLGYDNAMPEHTESEDGFLGLFYSPFIHDWSPQAVNIEAPTPAVLEINYPHLPVTLPALYVPQQDSPPPEQA